MFDFRCKCFLTAHECTLRACPFGDLPSAAWTAPLPGRRDTESPPGWRSPRAAPRTTSCRQKQTAASWVSAPINSALTFHQGWIGKVKTRDTHTSLWCVYIRSNRASGAIHLTGKRPCGSGMHVRDTVLEFLHFIDASFGLKHLQHIRTNSFTCSQCGSTDHNVAQHNYPWPL